MLDSDSVAMEAATVQVGTAVCPGTCLGSASAFVPGDGTFCRKAAVFASVVGVVQHSRADDDGDLVRHRTASQRLHRILTSVGAHVSSRCFP